MAASTLSKSPFSKTLDDYYKMVMDEYAEAGEGLLCRMVPDCPGGDFAHASYKWTPPEKLAWKLDRKAPCHINNLPGNPDLLLQSVHFPAEKDRVRGIPLNVNPGDYIGAKKPVIDIRISKEQFTRLEQVIGTPGLRVWVREVKPWSCMPIPSHIFVFTEEERTTYREDGFKKDGSDLPTLNGLIRRFESSGMGKITAVGSADNAADAMNAIVGHLLEQEGKKSDGNRG